MQVLRLNHAAALARSWPSRAPSDTAAVALRARPPEGAESFARSAVKEGHHGRIMTTTRRILIAAAASAGLTLGAGLARADETLRIGFQRSSTLITLLKANGELDKALAPIGLKVSWHEFTSGSPILESLNIGNIDLSADVADTVPIFAQAARAKIVYVAEEAASPSAQAILVGKDSPIQAVPDLKGKKVAVTKGSGSHYLLLAALAGKGLGFKDITPAYLTPADGRAALVSGNVDAWVAWDPFLSSAQRSSGARILADGTGLASYKRYYLASEAFTDKHADALAIVFKTLQQTGTWVKAHPKEAADLLAPLWGTDAETIIQANARRSYQVAPVTKDSLTEQQKIADAFQAEHVIPFKVDAGAARVWTAPK
jgi:sulfonate transport system substrate-binding protein